MAASALGSEPEQLTALAVLEYLSDLFTESPRESFTRDEVLILLSCVKNDGELFDPALVVAFDGAEG